MRSWLAALAMVGFACGAGAQNAAATAGQDTAWKPAAGTTTLTLWPQGAPAGTEAAGTREATGTKEATGANEAASTKTATAPEHDTTTAKDQLVAGRPVVRLGNVSVPTLTLYQPRGGKTGAAVVVFPGGGYNILAIDLEGTEVCDWLTSHGIACVLVKYRVPGTGPYPKSAAALQDAQRAVGMVREHAAKWGIDPKRVGVLGFSAGGHLAAALSTHFEERLYPKLDAADALSCRPDFQVVIYPGYLAVAEKGFEFNPEVPVTAQTPPAFLVQAEDDPVHVENATAYFLALKQAGVPAEMHLYAKGGHGYGLRKTALPVTTWPESAMLWLRTIGVVGGPVGAGGGAGR